MSWTVKAAGSLGGDVSGTVDEAVLDICLESFQDVDGLAGNDLIF